MRKLMIVASMLAMVLLVAAPAFGQSGGGVQQASNEVGDISVAGGDNVAASQYQYGDTTQENNTEVNVAQANQQAANGGGADQQASNEVGDISVAGGDNVAASQYQYGDTTQENNTSVNVAQGNQQVSGSSGSDVNAAQFNFFGLSSLFG